MQTFKKILFLLSYQERKSAGLLLIMSIIMALLDMIGIVSILPFISVLTNPSLIETNMILNNMFKITNFLGVQDYKQFLFVLGIFVFLLLIFSNAFKVLTSYVQIRFVYLREYSIGKRLVEGYLRQPYSWFLSRNSADLGKTILSEVSQVVGNGMRPLIDLIAKGAIAISIITLLIIVDPKLSIIVGLSLSCAYLLIFYFVRNYLNQTGEKRLINNELRFTIVNEAFGAAKEVKVGGLEEFYIKSFSNSAEAYAGTTASSQVISQLPRYILEAIAFGGILLIILYIMSRTGNFNNALPIISLYVFASYRLIPALQQIYACLTQLTFIGPSLNKLHDDLKSLKQYNKDSNQAGLAFNDKIILKDVHYTYPNSSRAALKDINLIIPAKSTVGFVGTTGGGKTTTIDIILGLLEPQKGTLEIDGIVIKKHNSRSWQQVIGYVPQNIYLSDNTIASNIAFGQKPDEINQTQVEKAAKIANLHDFIIDELPKKYQTKIGERGVRLSGGQCQRVGIARALYHNPKVIILDEATSSLDNETEKVVMEAVNNLSKDITIILIAHRLNTVKNCDNIYKLEKGQLVDQGSFNELIKNI